MEFKRLGFQHLNSPLGAEALSEFADLVAEIPSDAGGRRWAGAALETLLSDRTGQPLRRVVSMLVSGMSVLRVVAFKKDAGANWFVPAHQDRSIPVPSDDLPAGFSRPTRKGDGWQAEAPIEVLETMRNIRVFIDPATTDDGPLEIVPGTHNLGRIEQSAIPTIADDAAWHPITGDAGDVIILSPLLLHRSRRATEPRGRRVLQMECIPGDISGSLGLESFSLQQKS